MKARAVMKARAAMLLGLAFLLASAAAYLARGWIQDQARILAAATGAPRIETVKVVVSAVPLPFGTKLRREHLRLIDWPARAAPSGFSSSLESVLGDRQGGDPRYGDPRDWAPAVLRPIEKHEPILRSKIRRLKMHVPARFAICLQKHGLLHGLRCTVYI